MPKLLAASIATYLASWKTGADAYPAPRLDSRQAIRGRAVCGSENHVGGQLHIRNIDCSVLVEITGAALGLVPASIGFGNVTVGSRGTQTHNTDGFRDIRHHGFPDDRFRYRLSIGGPSLAVGQSASFNVTFTPAAAESASGSIAFVSNALNTPLDEALAGAGVKSPWRIADLAPPAILRTWPATTSTGSRHPTRARQPRHIRTLVQYRRPPAVPLPARTRIQPSRPSRVIGIILPRG